MKSIEKDELERVAGIIRQDNEKNRKKVLIGLSWVYANGRLHIGHVGSSLPADALARFHRLVGNDVSFITGSDCYGTPILVSAKNEGLTPEALAQKYHELLERDFVRLGFTFDNYTKTMSAHHNQFAMEWHTHMYGGDFTYEKSSDQLYCDPCKKYLPDRYVEGTCPHCKKHAKGDSCDGCGKMLEPEELIDPKCKLCGATPAPKSTTQMYLKLSAMQETLEKYYADKHPAWSINAQGLAGRYLKEGLHDRAITRNIEWGIPIPEIKKDWQDKRIYIWAENVLGYLSATKEFCEKTNRDWREFLLDETKTEKLHYYVHAKDNIPFHTIILPGLMLGNPSATYHKPDIIVASEYVVLEGSKMSKSAGTLLSAETLTDAFDVDLIRFYFLRNINDRKDFNFTFTDFVNTCNGELINNFGNLVNRTLSFVHSKFGGEVKVFDLDDIDESLYPDILTTLDYVHTYMYKGKTNEALKSAFELVNYGNKFFDDCKPWISIKEDEEKCRRDIFGVITIIANLAIMCEPFIPFACQKIKKWLGIEIKGTKKFDDFVHRKDFRLPEVEILFKRLDMKEVLERFKDYV
jgi:methionyl-tRNA synthetase